MTTKSENKIVFSSGLDGETAQSASGLTGRITVWNPDLFALGDVTVSVYGHKGRHVGTDTARNVPMTMEGRIQAANRLADGILDKKHLY